MHITMHGSIKVGDIYYVTFPKWPGTFGKPKTPVEYWHQTTVFQVTGEFSPENDYPFGYSPIKRVEAIPHGSRALVLKCPGVGLEAEQMGVMYSTPAERFVLCWVTNIDTEHSFLAMVGVAELWKEDPRKEFPPDPVPKLLTQAECRGMMLNQMKLARPT